MSDIFVPTDITANVIKVGGFCYERVGETTEPFSLNFSISSYCEDCKDCQEQIPAPETCPCWSPDCEDLKTTYIVTNNLSTPYGDAFHLHKIIEDNGHIIYQYYKLEEPLTMNFQIDECEWSGSVRELKLVLLFQIKIIKK